MRILLSLGLSLLTGCATTPPSDPSNLCAIFAEKEEWYESARRAELKWGLPIPVQMAILRQESSFVEDARPERIRFLGIPLWRPSSAYGYGQVLDGTWDWYTEAAGQSQAARDDFADVVEFLGWYSHQCRRKLGISPHDAYNLYLAYHEGLGGWRHGAHRSNPGLQQVARRVAWTARRYAGQLTRCRLHLESRLD
jgi:hypothetical protein